MQKKYIVLSFIIFVLLMGAIVFSYGDNEMSLSENKFYFPNSNKTGNLNDVTLKIYYMDFGTLSFFPLRIEDLTGGWYNPYTNQTMSGMYDGRIVVTNRNLISYSDLINKLFATELNPTGDVVVADERLHYLHNQRLFAPELYQIGNEILIDARLYYVFGHEEHGEIFSFVASGGGSTSYLLVNGIVVEHANIFFEVILPFLPKDIAEQVSRFIR